MTQEHGAGSGSAPDTHPVVREDQESTVPGMGDRPEDDRRGRPTYRFTLVVSRTMLLGTRD